MSPEDQIIFKKYGISGYTYGPIEISPAEATNPTPDSLLYPRTINPLPEN